LKEKGESRYGLAGLLIGVFVVGLIAIGVAIVYSKRQTRIEQVKERVQAELDQLDSIGRAQVLASVADEEYGIWDRLQNN
jgi:uncharacterized membrane protein YciS (DUF1049 family)